MYAIETKNAAQSLASLGVPWYMMLLENPLTDEELDTITPLTLFSKALSVHLMSSSVANDKGRFTLAKRLVPQKGVGTDYDFPVFANKSLYRVDVVDVVSTKPISDASKLALLTSSSNVVLDGSNTYVEYTLSKAVPVDYVQYETLEPVSVSAFSGTWHAIGGGQLCTKVRVTLSASSTLTVGAVRVFTFDKSFETTETKTVSRAVMVPGGAIPAVLGMPFPIIELEVGGWETDAEAILNSLVVSPGKYSTPMSVGFTINASAEV